MQGYKTIIFMTSALAGNSSVLSNGRDHLENMILVQVHMIVMAKNKPIQPNIPCGCLVLVLCNQDLRL